MTLKTKKRIRRFFLCLAFTSLMALIAVGNVAVEEGGLPFDWDFLPVFGCVTAVSFPLIAGLFQLPKVLDPLIDWCWDEADLIPVTKPEHQSYKTNHINYEEVKNERR